jgi:hypothetical protein
MLSNTFKYSLLLQLLDKSQEIEGSRYKSDWNKVEKLALNGKDKETLLKLTSIYKIWNYDNQVFSIIDIANDLW